MRVKIKEKILEWINELQKPQALLGDFPICPYARKAMLDNKVDIVILENAVWYSIEKRIREWDDSKELVLFVVEANWKYSALKEICQEIMYLCPEFILLVGHPENPFVLNGITTTFSTCPLIFLQKKENLKKAQENLEKTKYYSFWTENQLNELVNWR